MEKFIKTVKSYPCLWDMSDPAYKDFEMMDKAWVKVAAATSYPDAKSAKIQWKKLRDNFREALKRQKDSKYVGRTWRYQQQMEFLIPFMQSKNQDFSVDVDKNSLQSENSDTNQNAEDKKPVSFTMSLDEDANDSRSSFHKRKRKTMDDPKEDRSVEFGRSVICPGNALLDFFSSMYNTTEELPPQLQLQVKRKIFEVVAEAEETALMMQQQQQEYDAQYYLA